MFHRTVKLLVVAALVFATVLGLAGPSTAKVHRPKPAPASYYGMHYNRVGDGTWPQARIGSIRLWDTGTRWSQIQPARGVWNWSRLDTAVGTARAHGATVNLVLGLTAAWAQPDPTLAARLGDDLPVMPNLNDWWTYVHTVATRYKGRIGSYEVWNEPNLRDYWLGTPAQLATLAKVARHAVKTADPKALLVSPAPVMRGGVGEAWINYYANAKGYRWADVVGVHNYPKAGDRVSAALREFDSIRRLMRAWKIRKPLWDTETNIETNTAGSGSLSAKAQAAQLVAYYHGAWKHGVSRVYWYDWSATDNIGVRVAQHTGSLQPSEAGWAFTAMQL